MDVTEAGRHPLAQLEHFELWLDQQNVTDRLTFHGELPLATATSGTFCYAPDGGLAPGTYVAEARIRSAADPRSGYAAFVWWQFEVLPTR